MPVKTSHAAERVLATFDLVAQHQPIGISALAKCLGEDRSAVQRAVATLVKAGWVRPATGLPASFELTAHIFAIAALPQSMNVLRQRARGVLEALCQATGETAFVAIPDGTRFVVIEAVESAHALRAALRIGQFVEPQRTATGRAFLPYLSATEQAFMLGHAPSDVELAEFAKTKQRGYGLSIGDVMPGATNIAAPIFDKRGNPIGALVVSGPSERLSEDRLDAIGVMLCEQARRLSGGGGPAGRDNAS